MPKRKRENSSSPRPLPLPPSLAQQLRQYKHKAARVLAAFGVVCAENEEIKTGAIRHPLDASIVDLKRGCDAVDVWNAIARLEKAIHENDVGRVAAIAFTFGNRVAELNDSLYHFDHFLRGRDQATNLGMGRASRLSAAQRLFAQAEYQAGRNKKLSNKSSLSHACNSLKAKHGVRISRTRLGRILGVYKSK